MTSWSWYEVRAEAEEPVVMTYGEQAGNRTTTLVAITGSALRGAIAAGELRRRRLVRPPGRAETPPPGFLDVFESGRVRFPFLYLDDVPPAPLTHYHCKAEGLAHAEVDLLTATSDERCACGSRLDRAADRPPASLTRVRTRTAIGDDGVAAEGMLYAQEEIVEHTVFRGWILVHDQAADAFAEWVRPDEPHTLWVGADRSTSGRVHVRIGGPRRARPGRSVAERAAAWPEGEIALTARSPLLLADPWLRPARHADDALIARVLGLGPGQVEVAPFTAVRTRPLGGWHAAAGLPKPAEFAMVAGSAIRVRLSGVDRGELLGRLDELEADGVGMRRAEGFGDVIVCDPRHLDPAGACLRGEGAARPPRVSAPRDRVAERLPHLSVVRDLSLHHAERLYRSALAARGADEFDAVLGWAGTRPWAKEESVTSLQDVWNKARRLAEDRPDPELEPGLVALGAIRQWLEGSVRAKRVKAER